MRNHLYDSYLNGEHIARGTKREVEKSAREAFDSSWNDFPNCRATLKITSTSGKKTFFVKSIILDHRETNPELHYQPRVASDGSVAVREDW